MMAMDPAPFQARGTEGVKKLCQCVIMGASVARRLQIVVAGRWVCPAEAAPAVLLTGLATGEW